jgi:CRP-like cAMP-binding protein
LEIDEDVYFNLLRRVEFFDQLSDEELRQVASTPKFFQKFAMGKYIITEGSEDHSLYILLKGKAVVTKKSRPKFPLAILNEGTAFGEMSLISKRPRATDVIAYQGEAMTLRIDEKFLEEVPAEIQSKIKDKIIVILVNRLDDMNAKYSRLVK